MENFYTRDQYLDMLYQKFVEFGENGPKESTFLTAYPAEYNNAPRELVFGINVKFPRKEPLAVDVEE